MLYDNLSRSREYIKSIEGAKEIEIHTLDNHYPPSEEIE